MRDRISPRRFLADDSGAVATTYALALVGLVVAAGVGYDYAQVATLDTELQNAADQAALAAATQLDGKSGAIDRAKAAAQNYVGNSSLLASDAGAVVVDPGAFAFYEKKSDAENDTSPTTDVTKAKYVKLSILTRNAQYTLTPIISLINRSPNINASATAGLGSSICKVPPLFVCKPPTAIVDPVEWINSRRGYGILLKAKGASWSPGNFGFLSTNAGSGAKAISMLMAYANPPGDCTSVDAPEAAPGQKQSVVPDFNTRFDIYASGDNINCWSSNSYCPPADNARKDVVQAITSTPGQKDCDEPKGGWVFSDRPYRPSSAATLSGTTAANFPDAMGLPRDLCHAVKQSAQACTDGFVGTGDWDINAYWWANYGAAYPGTVPTAIPGRTYPTRYEVYRWEITNAPSFTPITVGGKAGRNYKAPICRAAPSATTPDRRVIPVAVVDCGSLTGGGASVTLKPLAWMDIFLVEPSLDRHADETKPSSDVFTSKGDFYGEIVRVTDQGTGGVGGQIVRRDKPFLVK